MKATVLRLGSAAVAGLAVVAIAAGCGSSSSSSSSGGSGSDLGLITQGTLTVGSDIPYPPFEQGKPPKYAGFDVDLVNAIDQKVGLKTKFQDTAFGTIFADLQAGKFDLVASATTITPARAQRVTFSKPYFNADQSLMVQKGSSIKSTSDITSGTRIAAQEGTTGQDYAEQHTDAAVQTYPAIGGAFNALQSGQVDGVINDFGVSAFAQKKYPQLDVIQTIPTGEHYGLAMQGSNTALQDAVNGGLSSVIKDGTYAKIFQKWFGGQPPKEFQPSG